MPLRPDDVVRKGFSTAMFRGYDEKQVDAFLEEVVTELRRLYGRIDTLEAQAALMSRGNDEMIGERVHREQQQIELIRAERRDLVSEIADAQARLDQITAEARAAEDRIARATAAGTGGEQDRSDPVRAALEQETVQAAREERLESSIGSGIRASDASERTLAAPAAAEHAGEAERQRADALADLDARRQTLEARIEDLDRRQTEYRQRIRALTQQQMAWLDDDGWKA